VRLTKEVFALINQVMVKR